MAWLKEPTGLTIRGRGENRKAVVRHRGRRAGIRFGRPVSKQSVSILAENARRDLAVELDGPIVSVFAAEVGR
jgi:hypothetical protein